MRMREKIARALVIGDGEEPEAFHTKASYELRVSLADHAIPLWRQAHYSRQVSAVLNALREPSEKMTAGWCGPEPWDDDALKVWQGMIDAALADW